MSHDDIDGNNSATLYNATLNADIPTSGEKQPLVTGEDKPYVTDEQPYLPSPQTRNMTRQLSIEANTLHRHNAANTVVDNVLNITNPSQRQDAVLQLLGDAKEDREGLLQRLVTNVAQSSMTINPPTALVPSTDTPSSFRSATSVENCDQWTKGNSN